MSKTAMTSLLCLILLASSGCEDSELERVGKALLAAGQAISIAQTTVIQANAQGLVSDDSTRVILESCVKANLAGKQAVAVTRQIKRIDPASRAQLIQILQPTVQAFQVAIDQGLTGVKNEDTKIKLQLVLTAVQTSLSTAWLILVSSGG